LFCPERDKWSKLRVTKVRTPQTCCHIAISLWRKQQMMSDRHPLKLGLNGGKASSTVLRTLKWGIDSLPPGLKMWREFIQSLRPCSSCVRILMNFHAGIIRCSKPHSLGHVGLALNERPSFCFILISSVCLRPGKNFSISEFRNWLSHCFHQRERFYIRPFQSHESRSDHNEIWMRFLRLTAASQLKMRRPGNREMDGWWFDEIQ
jgi:hypothetical protein